MGSFSVLEIIQRRSQLRTAKPVINIYIFFVSFLRNASLCSSILLLFCKLTIIIKSFFFFLKKGQLTYSLFSRRTK